MKQKLILLALVIGLTIVSQSSLSLGMGKIQVYSALDEPLRSSIELLTNADEDLQNLSVQLASSADYQKVGLDKSFVPSNIQVSLDEDNPYQINVTSNGPVTEPIVSLLLDVNWNNGRILREFTVLLDPPVYDSSSANVQVNNVVIEPVAEDTVPTVADSQEATDQPVLQQREPETTTYTNEDVADYADTSTAVETYNDADVVVSEGDTLWRIANNNKVGDLTTHQMMMAIFNTNPSAFIDNNINQLIKGSRLSMPGIDEARAISFSEALAQVESHHQSWAPADQDYSSFQTTETVADTYQEPESSLDYGVQLSGGDSDGSDSGQSNADVGDADAVQALEEDLYNKDSENTELKERISELEDIVEQQQDVLEIRDDSLANLEDQLGTANDGDATTDAGADDIWDADSSDSAGTEDGLDLAVTDVDTDGSDVDTGSSDASSVDDLVDTTDSSVFDPSSETESSEAQTVADTTDATTEPVQESTAPPKFNGGAAAEPESFIDTAINWVMDNLKWVLIGLVGLILVIFLPRALRKGDDDVSEETSFLDDIRSRDEAAAADDTVEADDADTKMNQPLDLADEETQELIDQDDDVLAELDKSITFGENDDDEFLVEDDEADPFADSIAEVKEDDGFDLDGFLNDDDDAADQNSSVTADHSETLADVDFDEDDQPTAEAEDDLSEVDDLFGDLDEELSLDELAEDVSEGADDLVADADAAIEEIQEAAEDLVESVEEEDFSFDDDDFDFDLDDELEEIEQAAEAEATVEDDAAEDAPTETLEDEVVDLSDEEFDDMLDISDEAADGFEIIDEDEGGMDEEIDLGLEDLMDEGDAIDTKLDLAKAYLDMGDAEGAKNLLDEIVTEGSDEQVAEAKKLLDGM